MNPWKTKSAKNNSTLDKFLVRPKQLHSGSPQKISIPPSSGFQPFEKPQNAEFLYPEYPQFRDYQFEICSKCITANTLVSLPTGLGKTHIASILILNFYRWFPNGRIFFLAPTRPLVEQQISCLSKFGQFISPAFVTTVKSEFSDSKRKELYGKKRIFFCTPQMLENDLKANRIDRKKIVLIIVDEAHKAVGNFAYVQVIKLMDQGESGFRIIGLSATPGNQKEKIQEVINNLLMENMILKNENDKNVSKYTKGKQIQPVYIALSGIIREAEQILNQFIQPCVECLKKLNAAEKYLLNAKNITKGVVFFIRNQFYSKHHYFNQSQKEIINYTLNFLHYIAAERQSLLECGYENFINKFIRVFQYYEASKENNKTQNSNNSVNNMESKMSKISSTDLQSEVYLLLERCSQKYFDMVIKSSGWQRLRLIFSSKIKIENHPKLEKLKSLLTVFFGRPEVVEKKSKVIVFANLRSTCFQIKKYIESDLLRAQMFFGQAKTTIQTHSDEGSNSQVLQLSQKDQIKLIRKYRDNEINILISTSIGEEGLDIGEVDAIFCYDGGMSNIRMVQRMGRTGRKRDGIVYVLLMEGKESENYHKATKKTKKMQKFSTSQFQYYCFNPSLLSEWKEIPIKFFKEPSPSELLQDSSVSSEKKKRKSKPKKKEQKQQEKEEVKKEEDQDKRKTQTIIAEGEEKRKLIIECYSSSSFSEGQSKSKYFEIVHHTHYTARISDVSTEQQYQSANNETIEGQEDFELCDLSSCQSESARQQSRSDRDKYSHNSSINSSEAVRRILELEEEDLNQESNDHP